MKTGNNGGAAGEAGRSSVGAYELVGECDWDAPLWNNEVEPLPLKERAEKDGLIFLCTRPSLKAEEVICK
jgi:hypothetical protein